MYKPVKLCSSGKHIAFDCDWITNVKDSHSYFCFYEENKKWICLLYGDENVEEKKNDGNLIDDDVCKDDNKDNAD